LRAICGGDDESRREAFSELSNNICHQGSRYAASPFAVPFLARIAVAGPGAARVDALGLLKMLAIDWYDEYELPLGINTVAWRAAVVPLEETLRELDEEIVAETRESKRQWLQEWRHAIQQGKEVEVFVELDYLDGGPRPEYISVVYKMDGKSYTRDIKNSPMQRRDGSSA
jgi:hypothetical protein